MIKLAPKGCENPGIGDPGIGPEMAGGGDGGDSLREAVCIGNAALKTVVNTAKEIYYAVAFGGSSS